MYVPAMQKKVPKETGTALAKLLANTPFSTRFVPVPEHIHMGHVGLGCQ